MCHRPRRADDIRPYDRARGCSVTCVNPSVFAFGESTSLCTREAWVRWVCKGCGVRVDVGIGPYEGARGAAVDGGRIISAPTNSQGV